MTYGPQSRTSQAVGHGRVRTAGMHAYGSLSHRIGCIARSLPRCAADLAQAGYWAERKADAPVGCGP
jgi:hypothetical protein